MFGHDDTAAAAVGGQTHSRGGLGNARMDGRTDGRTNNAIKEAKWPQKALAKVVIGKF